jgi:ribonuclease BN (tRNA processing enzyme)
MHDGLTILGGGGWFPAQGRHTACALWRRGDAAIMIDAGTGVGRLVERPELLEGVERLDIVLTHFHLDHICGLAYLSAIGAPTRVTIWGPGRHFYGVPTAELLAVMSHEPFHPVSLEDLGIAVRELPPTELELGGVRVRSRVQTRHSAPSLGLRFDDELTWITDTAYDPETARFAAGSSLLAHESWCTRARPRNEDIHSSAAQAATVARDAGVEDLLLIHLPPFEADVQALEDEARELLPRALLGAEGIHVPRRGAPGAAGRELDAFASAVPTASSAQVTGSSRKSA